MDTRPLHIRPEVTTTLLEQDQGSRPRQEDRDGPRFADLLELSSGTASGDERPPDPSVQADVGAGAGSQLPALELGAGEPSLDRSALRKLARVVWEAVRKGEPRVELRLLPRELGNLQLEIQVTGNQVHLRALTEDPKVVELLLENQHELAGSLARWGLSLASFRASAAAPSGDRETISPAVNSDDDNPRPLAADRRSFMEMVI